MDGFFGIGLAELFLIAVVALVVLGPERLPGALREVAKFIRTIRNMTNELTAQFGDEFKVLEDLNPQKILRELAEDPDEKAKAATKTAAKPGAKPVAKPASKTVASKPTTTKPAATSTAAKPAAPKPTTPKPTTTKPAVTTPKTAGAAASSKLTTVAKPTTESAVATAESEAVVGETAGETGVGAEATAQATAIVDLPGVKVFDYPHNLHPHSLDEPGEFAGSAPVEVEQEPSILPPARRELAEVESGSMAGDEQAEAAPVTSIPAIPTMPAIPIESTLDAPLAGSEDAQSPVSGKVDQPASLEDATAEAETESVGATDSLGEHEEGNHGEASETENPASEAVIPAKRAQIETKSANGNHAAVTEEHFSDKPVNGDHGNSAHER